MGQRGARERCGAPLLAARMIYGDDYRVCLAQEVDSARQGEMILVALLDKARCRFPSCQAVVFIFAVKLCELMRHQCAALRWFPEPAV